jgi:hypothetical protein
VVIGTNECAAAASNNYGEEVGAKGSTVAAASSAALGGWCFSRGVDALIRLARVE